MSVRFTLPAVLVHWVTAVLVVTLIILGRYMVELPQGTERSETYALHKSLGMTVFLLTVFRIAWRLQHPPPRYPQPAERLRAGLARLVHCLFYIALVLQPLSGYLSSSFSGYKTRFFGLALPHWGHKAPALNEFFTSIHVACSIFLMTLIVFHVLGALWHLSRRDGIFKRMLPFTVN